MSEGNEKPLAAFLLSLIGGLLILANSSAFLFGMAMMGFGGMMGGMGMMGPALMGFPWFMSVLALVFGVLIILGATILYTRPEQAQTWGIVILILSVLSLLSGGGFFVGSILGILGGVLALITKQ